MANPRYVYSTVEAYGERAVVGTCQRDAMPDLGVRQRDGFGRTPEDYRLIAAMTFSNAMREASQEPDWYSMAWYLSQLGDA